MYACILRMLYRLRRSNQTWRTYPLFLLAENRWRAQRYGVEGTLFDLGKGELVAFAELVDELTGMLHEDAAALDCVEELEHARRIVAHGTSADRQVALHRKLLADGLSPPDALKGIVDHLIAETAGEPGARRKRR
jgi:carboxylate-amine ligase